MGLLRPNIANDPDHSDKVIAVGPMPNSMVVWAQNMFNDCRKLEVCDAVGFAPYQGAAKEIFRNCRALKNIPYFDASNVSDFSWAFHGVPVTKFPALDTSSGTDFNNAFFDCTALTEFPPIDFSNAQSL